MYYLYFDKLLLPVAPTKVQTTINNKNKTVTLINEGEVNILKSAGLTEVTFDLLLPVTQYPFALYKNGFKSPFYFLEQIEKLKISLKPFQFMFVRYSPNHSSNRIGNTVFETPMAVTNMTVSLEDYTIKEDVKEGFDIVVSIKLLQYVKYGTKKVTIKSNNKNDKKVVSNAKSRESNKKMPNTYTVKKGDTLWGISKKLLGDGAKCWELAKYNKISNPNKIYVGQLLKIKDVKATTSPTKNTVNGKKESSTNKSTSTSTVSASTKNSIMPIAIPGVTMPVSIATNKRLAASYGYRVRDPLKLQVKKDNKVLHSSGGAGF